MRIVSLEPFLTELICYLGRESELVGISHRCDAPESVLSLPRVTAEDETLPRSLAALSRYPVRIDDIIALSPDLVLTSVVSESDTVAATVLSLTEGLRALCGNNVRVLSYAPERILESPG
jgi:iron complex transport system substrate-binding protein